MLSAILVRSLYWPRCFHGYSTSLVLSKSNTNCQSHSPVNLHVNLSFCLFHGSSSCRGKRTLGSFELRRDRACVDVIQFNSFWANNVLKMSERKQEKSANFWLETIISVFEACILVFKRFTQNTYRNGVSVCQCISSSNKVLFWIGKVAFLMKDLQYTRFKLCDVWYMVWCYAIFTLYTWNNDLEYACAIVDGFMRDTKVQCHRGSFSWSLTTEGSWDYPWNNSSCRSWQHP